MHLNVLLYAPSRQAVILYINGEDFASGYVILPAGKFVNDSFELFCQLFCIKKNYKKFDSVRNKTVDLFMDESLNNLIHGFVQKHLSRAKQVSSCIWNCEYQIAIIL